MVASVIVDAKGIFAWGWNHAGFDGCGGHAEAHAVLRANPSRLNGSTIYIAGIRKRNGIYVMSRPCEDCLPILIRKGITKAHFSLHGPKLIWQSMNIRND
jgi:deoxycytidylate deaminase